LCFSDLVAFFSCHKNTKALNLTKKYLTKGH
jgi:hypothetical protein